MCHERPVSALVPVLTHVSPYVGCTRAELEDALEELFTAIGTASDHEGRLLSTWFQLVPHRTVSTGRRTALDCANLGIGHGSLGHWRLKQWAIPRCF